MKTANDIDAYRQVTNEEICLFYNAISSFSKILITPLRVSAKETCLNFLCNAIEQDKPKATIVKIKRDHSGNATVTNITAL